MYLLILANIYWRFFLTRHLEDVFLYVSVLSSGPHEHILKQMIFFFKKHILITTIQQFMVTKIYRHKSDNRKSSVFKATENIFTKQILRYYPLGKNRQDVQGR